MKLFQKMVFFQVEIGKYLKFETEMVRGKTETAVNKS